MKKYLFEDITLSIPESKEEIKSVFSKLLSGKKVSTVSFINPEIFLAQEKNLELHDYFKNTEYNFIDGIGLIHAINKKLGTSYGAESRFPGTDFFDYLPDDRKTRIYLYGSKIENLEKIENIFSRFHSNHNHKNYLA